MKPTVIKTYIPYQKDRDAMVIALTNSGYKTWIEVKRIDNKDVVVVCFESLSALKVQS